MIKSSYLQRLLAMLTLCAVLIGSLTVPAAAVGFQDVPAGHWAETEIRRCAELGFFKGKTETQFGLGQSMTRSAFVVVLCRFFGWETPAPAVSSYDDVPTDAWYAGALEAAYTHGAVTSQQDNFRPADAITREELTVMLVRALGYGSLTGLAQDSELPFEDVDTNAGYITMAYHLGLMNGTSATTFSPDRNATREQVAVILMRLHDKLSAPAAFRSAILSRNNLQPDLTGLNAALIPAQTLDRTGKLQPLIGQLDAAALRSYAQEGGVPALLYVTGDPVALRSDRSSMAQALVNAVEQGGYDGLVLDIPAVTSARAAALTELVSSVGTALGDRPLQLIVEPPARQNSASGGYDYAALSAAADRLILRVAPLEATAGSTAIAAVEPPEEVYYALSTLKGIVPVEKLGLLVTTAGLVRTRTGRNSGTITTEEIFSRLAVGTMDGYYSSRYACAYLHNTSSGETVWYLNEEAAAQRAQLLRLTGVGTVCLSDWDSASAELLQGLN